MVSHQPSVVKSAFLRALYRNGTGGRETGFTTGAQPTNNSDTYYLNWAVSFISARIQMRDNETLSFYNFSTSDEIDTARRRTCGKLAQITGAAADCTAPAFTAITFHRDNTDYARLEPDTFTYSQCTIMQLPKTFVPFLFARRLRLAVFGTAGGRMLPHCLHKKVF